MFYEGLAQDALELVRTVDERHHRAGRYFDHQEWGGHYFRGLSAWTIISGALGFAVNGTAYTFAPALPGKKLRLFFSFGQGTGHYERAVTRRGATIRLNAHTGTLNVRALHLATGLPQVRTAIGPLPSPYRVQYDRDRATIDFTQEVRVTPAAPPTIYCG